MRFLRFFPLAGKIRLAGQNTLKRMRHGLLCAYKREVGINWNTSATVQHGFGNRISRVSGASVPARLRYCLFSTASQRHPAHRAVPQGEQPCTNAGDLAGSYSI